ncbi:hypothetical protein M3O96_21655 [Aquiflexum sp. TKW24L]|uniref:hypothetical protein n=1 Tax=Aquiflexum sp. TKW24L TaxID=2942212 RepID=UPI0020C074B6|nr:hypothetical protein [Aquiflexum sp. TKW24L]MCL6261715.1 hypothetical protein [Aquiflexum sp. TKW24L]
MKIFYTLLTAFCLFAFQSNVFSATRTVSNKSGDVAQFTSLQEAITASADGDIILISGSPTSYGNVTMAKRLTLIGPGSNLDFNGGHNATIGTMTFSSAQTSKSVLQGLKIGTITITAAECDEVQVKRCEVAYIVNQTSNFTRIPQKWILEESVIYSSGIANRPNNTNLSANWSIRNCYLYSTVALNGSIFENNVWVFSGHSGNGNIYNNNIYFSSSFSQVTGGSFANNIFDNAPTIDFNANSSSGNFFSTDPQVVSFRADFFPGDFSLKPGSPGINAGTDGRDIGMFGGRGFLITMIPGIPSVQSFIILNPSVPQNGTLNIKVEGKANN